MHIWRGRLAGLFDAASGYRSCNRLTDTSHDSRTLWKLSKFRLALTLDAVEPSRLPNGKQKQ